MGFGTNIKFSPLVLFILLLLILALSVFVGNSIQSWVNPEAHDFESFIGYNYSVSLMSSQTIPDYSTINPLIKIYDNLYFDNKNGNVVKLLSTAYGGNTATYGGNTQLKAISVCGRDGISCSGAVQLPVTAPIPNSTLNTMTSSYTFFMPSSNLYNGAVTISEGANNVVNTSSTSSFFSNNLMFYVAWKTDTFLHVIDSNTTGNIPYSALSAYIPANGTPVVRYYDANRSNPGTLKNQYPVQLNDIGTNLITDPNNNKMVSLQNYDSNKTVFQMSPGVFFDVSNGSLIINQPAGGINVYQRPTGTSSGSYVDPTPQSFTGGRIATDTSATVSSVSYFPYYLITPDSNYLVMYIATGQNTVLYVMTMRNKQFTLYNLKRFIGNNSAGANGVIDNDGTLISPTRSGTSGSGVSNSGMNFGFSGSYSDTNPVSDYYRWLAFWNTVANGTNQTSLKSASNMVSKSSVVPSVCPNCPNCKNCNGGVCTGCGGQGGSGTNFGQGQVQWGYYGGGSGGREGEPGPGRILYDTGSGTKDLLEKTGSGTTGLVRDAGKAGLGVAAVGAGLGVAAVQGGVGLAKETVGGGVGLAKETVGGAVGLAKETVGGTIDLVKGAGTGAVNLLGNKNPTQVGEPGDGSSESDENGRLGAGGAKRSLGKQGIPGIDPYSYYGALPAKGANYMPITADFSAFSR